MKIVLIGAGSAQFGYGALGDAFGTSALAGAEIALVDINVESLEVVRRSAESFVQERNLSFTITATTDRREALPGADFVIISIEVGDRFLLWDQDWKTPMQYGISQIYGENGGPGGIFHALRITPPILAICDDVARLCPEATVFNYSNPMTAITTAVLRKYPDMNFIGMCHEIASLERYLPLILETPAESLELRAAGLNHFSVLLEARYRETGKDAYPDILEKAPSFFEKEPGYRDVWDYVKQTGKIPVTEGAHERWDIDRNESADPWTDRYLFRAILETYKLLPITLDSHLGEYISWARDVADHRGILDFYEFYRHALTQKSYSGITLDRHERASFIMEDLVTGNAYEEKAVNVMNNGAIPVLPDYIAVEVPAIVNADGIHPVKFDTYPKGFGALLRNYAGVYDLTADAILEGSRDLVLQAVLACPMVDKYHGMSEMVDAMIAQNGEWLEYIR